MELLTVKNLSFTYPNCAKPAIHDVSFAIEKGTFVTVCGATGSGKSTLLRLLKRELAPLGTLSGEICFEGKLQSALTDACAAYRIGYVMQRPEQQIVTDKVWHELAFGLENMGIPQAAIARRVGRWLHILVSKAGTTDRSQSSPAVRNSCSTSQRSWLCSRNC